MDAYLFRQDVVRIQMTMTTMMKRLEPNFCRFFLFCWYYSSLIPKSAQEGMSIAMFCVCDFRDLSNHVVRYFSFASL